MGSNTDSDKFLLKKLKSGDKESFRKVYLKYHEKLYHIALKYLRSKDLAEDAVQDVFIKLWDTKENLKTNGSLGGFLFTAIKNHVLNMIDSRKRKIKKEALIRKDLKDQKLNTASVIVLSEYKELYRSLIQQLPEKRREIYELRVKDGLTNKEIAQYLDISIHTVKSQYYKASNYIKEQLEMKSTG